MFQKPAFGSTNTTGFGSFNAGASATSPFGGFKSTTGTSAFGAPPAFGATPVAQPTTGGGLFGATNTSGGLFGASTSAAPAPAFGSTGGFGFGANTSTSGGLFGANTSGGGLFANTQQNNAFAAKPAGFGFGGGTTTTSTGGGLFGAAPAPTNTLFGQQNNTMGGGGLFGNTTGAFGQPTSGTGHAKYSAVVGTDVIVKSGNSQTINIKHHCITCMKEYEGKSLEELRLEDYTAGRKGTAGGAGGVFGFQQPAENKPMFPTSSFGQPATTSAPSVFGGGTMGTTSAFGQNSSFSFGGTPAGAANNTGSLFGANKPAFGATSTAGTGLFGGSTTQTAPSFGANTNTFGGFGTAQTQQPGGLFGAKPATSTFGATNTSFGGFGATTSAGMFGAAKPNTNATPFAAPNTGSAFGSLGGGFGANTSTSGGLFGANTFGKPATTQPAFGFNTQPSLGAGLGTNTFQNKPAGGFGTLGGGGLFSQPAQNNTFKTGLEGGLGGGIFGNNASTLGGNSLGLGGLGANNTSLTGNNLSGSVPGNVHEQILTLAALTYGDSPLFKDLKPETSLSSESALKPTNPLAVQAVLDAHNNAYRVASPAHCHTLSVRTRSRPTDKKSLFDGLEESDATLEDKLTLKPSMKRLVLRQHPRQDANNSVENTAQSNNRSTEDQSQRSPSLQQHNLSHSQQTRDDHTDAREMAQSYQQNNTNLEVSSERHGRWLSGSKVQWSDKENPIDNEPTPRIYPDLEKEKELPAQVSERRASWLTTKPLRKPLASHPDSVENSVRELAVRRETHDEPRNSSVDKENVDSLSVSEDENVSPRDCPPHPSGVKLTRPGYYTIPSLDEMINYMRADGSCVVPHLTVGRKNYGNVYYDCEIDVAGLDLDSLVHFLNKEVIVYPEDSDKPPVGEALNRRAIVTLDRIWPRDKTEKRPITDPDRLLKMDYEGKLRRVCDKHDTKFIEYRPQTGSWVFRVEHFSKYGLTDSDEEDDPTPDVMKRQLVTQSLQRNAAPPPVLSKPLVPMPPLGLGGAGLMPENNLYAMQQTSLNLLNGAGKSSFRAFDMDTAEENSESQSLYQDSNKGFNVKSPTSELARLEHRHSHSVQLMKASLYVDTEMEEDNMSVSTGDQLVPLLPPARSPPMGDQGTTEGRPDLPLLPVHSGGESQMRPLIVHPEKIILRYHRKVPPFKETIAGRLGASCISDMSVSRARHSRVGFSVRGAMAFPTTYQAVHDLPKSAQLCDIGNYLSGRGDNDWSEPLVARIAIGQANPHTSIKEILTNHMSTLLKYSTVSDSSSVRELAREPKLRRAALRELCRDAAKASGDVKFGVSNAYCLEVWRLCEALWGADLDNDGVPATDELSIVNRYRSFVDWLTSAVKVNVDRELARPCNGEAEDECDGHSYRIWWLLSGGRVMAACQLAVESRDYNMAAIIAQGAGDPSFRSLLSRQLSQWRECGADSLISSYRLATLQLVAGSCPDKLLDEHWITVLHNTARYLVPQATSLEGIVSKYESILSTKWEGDDNSQSTRVQRPLPEYLNEYDVTVSNKEKCREVFDLRYELIRARAFNTRPKLQPAAYTADPLDYSLCFLVGVWFGNPSCESVCGMADQLETYGLWHLAVQALTYHPEHNVRAHLIKGVLSRNAPAVADTEDLVQRIQGVTQLGLPQEWLLSAQACRAKYQHMPLVEAEHLIGAGEYNAAHKVLLKELLPEAVLADELHTLAPLLEKLNEAATRHEVAGWESGGQALYQYMNICDQIRSLAESGSDETSSTGILRALEGLRPAAVLKHFDASVPRGRCARAWLGGRLAVLPRGLAPPARAAALLRALALPPHHAHAHIAQIASELAEQASEMCIQSPDSSPHSSHPLQTMQS